MKVPNDPQLDMCKDRPCINCHGTMTNDQGSMDDDGSIHEYGFSCDKCTTTMNITVDKRGGDMVNGQSELPREKVNITTVEVNNSGIGVREVTESSDLDDDTIVCERKLPWLEQPYRKVDGQYMPNIIILDEVTNRVLERYCEPRGSSEEASHEYTYNGTTIRWLKREYQ